MIDETEPTNCLPPRPTTPGEETVSPRKSIPRSARSPFDFQVEGGPTGLQLVTSPPEYVSTGATRVRIRFVTSEETGNLSCYWELLQTNMIALRVALLL